MENIPFDCWAFIELFGHDQIAGRVCEAPIGNGDLIRVDVPEQPDMPAFTKLIGSKAIFSLTIVDEATVQEALKRMRPVPVQTFMLPQLTHGQGYARDFDEDDDHEF